MLGRPVAGELQASTRRSSVLGVMAANKQVFREVSASSPRYSKATSNSLCMSLKVTAIRHLIMYAQYV